MPHDPAQRSAPDPVPTVTDAPAPRAGDARLDEALSARGIRDPRPGCRAALRSLREESPAVYDEQIRYFNEVLVPSAAEGADPIGVWTDYARQLADASASGRTVRVDPSGRRAEFDSTGDPGGGIADEEVLLHVPESTRARISVLRAPERPSSAQSATIGVLTEGWRTLPADPAESTN